ncbi:type 1 fimbrial protein [Salmonella enterica]|nr:type 1 fimbrial protein [Salmonella enterica]
MKIKNRLFLLGAAMAVMSSSAFADTTGTQTFTANIVANTCAITGLNEVVQFPDFTRQQVKAAGHDKSMIGGSITHTFNVSGCPASMTQMTMQLDYTQATTPSGKPVPELTGTGKGVALWLYKTATGANYFMSGDKPSYTITNGAASSLIRIDPYGWFPNGDSDIVGGSYSTTLNLTFDFT